MGVSPRGHRSPGGEWGGSNPTLSARIPHNHRIFQAGRDWNLSPARCGKGVLLTICSQKDGRQGLLELVWDKGSVGAVILPLHRSHLIAIGHRLASRRRPGRETRLVNTWICSSGYRIAGRYLEADFFTLMGLETHPRTSPSRPLPRWSRRNSARGGALHLLPQVGGENALHVLI